MGRGASRPAEISSPVWRRSGWRGGAVFPGHVVLIGHDYVEPTAATTRLLRNALENLPYTALPDFPKRRTKVLMWCTSADCKVAPEDVNVRKIAGAAGIGPGRHPGVRRSAGRDGAGEAALRSRCIPRLRSERPGGPPRHRQGLDGDHRQGLRGEGWHGHHPRRPRRREARLAVEDVRAPPRQRSAPGDEQRGPQGRRSPPRRGTPTRRSRRVSRIPTPGRRTPCRSSPPSAWDSARSSTTTARSSRRSCSTGSSSRRSYEPPADFGGA